MRQGVKSLLNSVIPYRSIFVVTGVIRPCPSRVIFSDNHIDRLFISTCSRKLMIAKPCQLNEDYYFYEWLPRLFVKLCILPRGVGKCQTLSSMFTVILRQPDNWALNKTKGTGDRSFVALKEAFFFSYDFSVYGANSEKLKRRKNRGKYFRLTRRMYGKKVSYFTAQSPELCWMNSLFI